MNILVVGAGAVGSVVAVALARADHAVTVLVRPERLPATGRLRIALHVTGQDDRWAIVPAISTITEPPDLVIVAVKSRDLPAAVAALAGRIGSVPVVTLALALDGDASASAALGHGVTGGLFTGQAETVTPGHVRVHHPGFVVQSGPAAEALATALPLVSAADLAPWRAGLLAATAPQALAALADRPLLALREDHAAVALCTAMLIEASQTFAHAPLPLADLPDLDIALVRRLPKIIGFRQQHAVHNAESLWRWRSDIADPLTQDVHRRCPTETEARLGAIVHLGAAHGVATPILTGLLALMQAREAEADPLAPEQIRKRVRG